ncbi:MAG: hypothetical protein SV186_05155 [Candidatus Nanohaloarchaea archaeon]|nr:hypothetical protein [Candidatus Nanohaloarchaea archaeon]
MTEYTVDDILDELDDGLRFRDLDRELRRHGITDTPAQSAEYKQELLDQGVLEPQDKDHPREEEQYTIDQSYDELNL